MVGDGDAMGVTSQIVQHMLGSAEGWLGVDDPVLLGEGTQKRSEVPLVAERQTLAVKPKLVVAKSASESGATNLPRKTRLSTLTGRKKLVGAEIQWE